MVPRRHAAAPPARRGQRTTHSPRQERTFEAGYTPRAAPPSRWGWTCACTASRCTAPSTAPPMGWGATSCEQRRALFHQRAGRQGRMAGAPAACAVPGLNAWQMGANPDAGQAMPPTFTQGQRTTCSRRAGCAPWGVFVQDDSWATGACWPAAHDALQRRRHEQRHHHHGLDRSDSATSGSLGVMYEASPLLRPYANLARISRRRHARAVTNRA